tara:strand:- start:16299 stop:17090 length:792 start_codon:yes stop_codon:yes gene_type:complete
LKKNLFLIFIFLLNSCSGSQPTSARIPSSAASSQNRPPVIEKIETTPRFVSFMGEAITRAIASDPDFDRLNFSWEIKGGKILEGKNTPLIKWKADEGSEKINIKVTVKDSDGYKEENSEIELTNKKISLIHEKPEEEKSGEKYKVFLKMTNVESFSLTSIQLNYPSEKIILKSITFNGIEKNSHKNWYAITENSPLGKITIILFPNKNIEKNGGKIATLDFILRDDLYPEIEEFYFKNNVKENGTWNAKKEEIPVALTTSGKK